MSETQLGIEKTGCACKSATAATETEYLTHEALAVKLSTSIKTVRKWSYERRLPGRVSLGGRCVRYNRLAIEKALNSGSLLLKKRS